MLGRQCVQASVGMPVMVNMAGLRRYGLSVGQTPPVPGRIVALGRAGVTVKLSKVLEGFDTITLNPDRVVAAS